MPTEKLRAYVVDLEESTPTGPRHYRTLVVVDAFAKAAPAAVETAPYGPPIRVVAVAETDVASEVTVPQLAEDRRQMRALVRAAEALRAAQRDYMDYRTVGARARELDALLAKLKADYGAALQ